MDYTIHPIAHIRTDFTDKFGIPRQSGLVPELTARIVFEPEYRDPNALVGIEGYDRLWLIWQFSTVAAEYAAGKSWRPTVRPPRLGGNERRGVFATRSPYRPNALLCKVPENKRAALFGVLKNDPRPAYQHDPERVYTLDFGCNKVKFTVDGDILKVVDIL